VINTQARTAASPRSGVAGTYIHVSSLSDADRSVETAVERMILSWVLGPAMGILAAYSGPFNSDD
jgi:hypothetical protein